MKNNGSFVLLKRRGREGVEVPIPKRENMECCPSLNVGLLS